jgi:hypothetical protein
MNDINDWRAKLLEATGNKYFKIFIGIGLLIVLGAVGYMLIPKKPNIIEVTSVPINAMIIGIQYIINKQKVSKNE